MWSVSPAETAECSWFYHPCAMLSPLENMINRSVLPAFNTVLCCLEVFFPSLGVQSYSTIFVNSTTSRFPFTASDPTLGVLRAHGVTVDMSNPFILLPNYNQSNSLPDTRRPSILLVSEQNINVSGHLICCWLLKTKFCRK